MSLLTPPSTSHRADKDNASKFSFSLSMNVDLPKLTVSTPAGSSSLAELPTPASASSSRTVVWSQSNSFHSLATPPKPRPSSATTNAMVKDRPVKPILKRRRTTPPLNDATNAGSATASNCKATLSLPEDLDTFFRQRESTPQPDEALFNLQYLEYPVALILKPDAKLRELIEGYSILNARIRGTVQFTSDSNTSWPLFQPIRKNKQALVDCIIRDLQRAFVDPVKSPDCPKGDDMIPNENWDVEAPSSRSAVALPSPKKSPKKAKKGMSAEQVKFARDLCTTSHSVIKLLCVLLCFPAVHGVFEHIQLRCMLGALLSIPMAVDLPTPNARKTCALAIMVLQCQRLPKEVLIPTRDRIALALKRGIDGELGKEGKKGSANDGLKAIGDLSMYQPLTFVPIFAKATILPSILKNLIAPTLALRLQACHALGGFAYALAGLPPSNIHATASDMVAEFILNTSIASPTVKGPSPAKEGLPAFSPVMRTLRTTMMMQDPTHICQSPAWALCVFSSFITILGSRMYTNRRLCTTIMSVFKLGARHKRGAIRHLFCAAWRSVSWAWFQPDYDLLRDEDGESEQEEEDDEQDKSKSIEQKKVVREAYFDIMKEIIETQAGASIVAALLSVPPPPTPYMTEGDRQEDALRRVFVVLRAMASSPNPDTISDAAASLTTLVAQSGEHHASSQPNEIFKDNSLAMLPQALFSPPTNNGVLSADVTITTTGSGSLMAAIRPMFDELPNVEEVRALTKEELSQGWVVDEILGVWRIILGTLEIADDVELPAELNQTWEALLISSSGIQQEEHGDATNLANTIVDVLVSIFNDAKLDFTIKTTPPTSSLIVVANNVKETTSTNTCSNAELKVNIVKGLWSTVKTVFARSDLGGAAEKMLSALLQHTNDLTAQRKKKHRTISGVNNTHITAPVTAWANLCATVMLDCGDGETDTAEAMKMFWGIGAEEGAKTHWDSFPELENHEVMGAIWKSCVDMWVQNEGHWEGASVLLAAPFAMDSPRAAAWTLTSEEGTKWNELYKSATDKALDCGMDSSSTTVMDAVAEIVSTNLSSTTTPARLIQVTDILMDHLEPSELREAPVHLVQLLDATLKGAYPFDADLSMVACWFVQTLTRVLENLPKDLVKEVVETVGDNLVQWLSDESEMWKAEEIDYTVLPLYQHLLLRIQELPKDLKFLSGISPLLDSVFSGRVMPEKLQGPFKDAFGNFWNMSHYSKMDEPLGGWPQPLRHCLGLEDEIEELPAVEVPATPSTPSRKSVKDMDGIHFPRTPMAVMNGANIASPRRPHKPQADPADLFLHHLPFHGSPLSPIRRRRVSSGSAGPSSSLGASPFIRNAGIRAPESPSKRRRSMDQEQEDHVEKENSSPQVSPKRRRTGLTIGGMFEWKMPALVLPQTMDDSDAATPPSAAKKGGLKLRERMGAKSKGKSASSQLEVRTPRATIPRIRLGLDKAAAQSAARRAATPRQRTPSPTPSASSQGSNDSDDERVWVERELVPFPTMDDTELQSDEAAVETTQTTAVPQTPISKKRKRMAADSGLISAAEMLEVTRAKSKRKLEHSASFDSSSSSSRIPKAWLTPIKSGRELKRSATAPVSMPHASAKWMNNAREMRRSCERSLDAADDEDQFEAQVRTKEPLPALQITGSRSSPQVSASRQVEAKQLSSDGPSSDDSQHLGQVTPHHLLSPKLVMRTSKVYVSKSKLEFRTPSLSLLAPSSSSGSKLSATSQVLKAGRVVPMESVPGSDDSVDGAPDSSPTRRLAERRRVNGIQRMVRPSLTPFKRS